MPAPELQHNTFSMEPREFKLFRALIQQHTGIWLRDSKNIMLAARLSRRLRHLGLNGFAQYYEYIQHAHDKSAEIVQLINSVTTNKTSFFREQHHFTYLANQVVPEKMASAQHGGGKSIRIWSAACSTGEEPYSIAITLLEALQCPATALDAEARIKRSQTPGLTLPAYSWRIEVVASDIDTAVLATAQRAIYRRESLSSVPQPLWKKYFLRGMDDMQSQVKVKPEVARLVHFQRLNLMDAQWPLQGRFDVIFFRNALIYFNQQTQDTFLRKMACCLNPRGYLFLGNAEHIPWLHNIYEPLQQTMYRLR